jgi:hypothetical protein
VELSSPTILFFTRKAQPIEQREERLKQLAFATAANDRFSPFM